MIKLTKLNNEEFIVNSNQIQMIELIPESKIVLMNREFFVVRESEKEIIDKIIRYNAEIFNAANISVMKKKD